MIHTAARIQKTGGDESGYLFQHLILTEEEYKKMDRDTLKKFSKENQIDFVSVQLTGTIDYYHVAESWKKTFIEENGIHATDEWVHDLGKGIYAVPQVDGEAINNLKTYVGEEFKIDDEIVIVEGTYKGPYLKCVYGDQHEGYIVLQREHIPIEEIGDIYTMNIEDFLFSF